MRLQKVVSPQPRGSSFGRIVGSETFVGYRNRIYATTYVSRGRPRTLSVTDVPFQLSIRPLVL